MSEPTTEERCPHGYTGPHNASGMSPAAADDHCSGPGSWYPPEADLVKDAFDEAKDRCIAALAVFEEHVDPCANGHVEHDAAAHIGRRLVHTYSGGFGADWDYDEAVAFIRTARRIRATTGMLATLGHGATAWSPEGRMVAFDTHKDVATMVAREDSEL